MDRRATIAVAVGGAAGASLRWALVESAIGEQTGWPWAILTANVLGAGLLGGLWAAFTRGERSTPVFLGAAVGFCGALTTFSGFAVDVAYFLRTDQFGDAIGYLLASVGLGWGAFASTRALAGRAWS